MGDPQLPQNFASDLGTLTDLEGSREAPQPPQNFAVELTDVPHEGQSTVDMLVC
jgi:hypothetical protein